MSRYGSNSYASACPCSRSVPPKIVGGAGLRLRSQAGGANLVLIPFPLVTASGVVSGNNFTPSNPAITKKASRAKKARKSKKAGAAAHGEARYDPII